MMSMRLVLMIVVSQLYCAVSVAAVEIVIPLDDFRQELVIKTTTAGEAKGWDATKIDRCVRDLMIRARATATFNVNHIVFEEYYTGSKDPVPLSEIATVAVRELTFVPSNELEHLAAD